LPIDTSTAPPRWEIAAHSFVEHVLVAALAKKVTKFFRRSAFHYIGPNLAGEYWLPGFRLAPALPSDDFPMMVNAERVLFIDQTVEAIDNLHSIFVADEIARRHAARLSLLLNIGLYRPPPEQIWVLRSQPEQPYQISERRHWGFIDPKGLPSVMPAKGAECPLGPFEGSVMDFWPTGGLLACPSEIRRILRGVNHRGGSFSEAFDKCARLFQVARVAGKMFGSVGLAYQIAAVEAITKAGTGYDSFADFMRKNLPATDGLDSYLDLLYGSVRSAHFHAGEFPLGEFVATRMDITDTEACGRTDLGFFGSRIIRKAIMAWIMRTITEAGE